MIVKKVTNMYNIYIYYCWTGQGGWLVCVRVCLPLLAYA